MESKIEQDRLAECTELLCGMVLPIVDIVAHKVANEVAKRWGGRETVAGAPPVQVIIEAATKSVEPQLRRKMPAVATSLLEPKLNWRDRLARRLKIGSRHAVS